MHKQQWEKMKIQLWTSLRATFGETFIQFATFLGTAQCIEQKNPTLDKHYRYQDPSAITLAKMQYWNATL